MVETGSAGFESDFRKKVEFQTPLGCIGQLENITLWCFPGIVRLFRDNGREISCRRRLRVIPGWISKRATIKLRNKIALSPEERAAWAWPTKHIVAEGVDVFISGRHPEPDAAVREIGGKATRGAQNVHSVSSRRRSLSNSSSVRTLDLDFSSSATIERVSLFKAASR
jgi:hypothetical protein